MKKRIKKLINRDKDTGVCYIAIGNCVTPLYNADGSLKIHKEVE